MRTVSQTGEAPRAAGRRGRIGGTALLLLAPVFVAGCKDSTGISRAGTFNGNAVAVGSGTGHTFVTLDSNGNPTELGVSLSESALDGLPSTLPGTDFELPLPVEATATPFQQVVLDWNPQGHEPRGVYTVPHFDFHFYLISAAERDAITPADPDFAAKLAKQPAPEFIPAGYVPTPGGVPRMGAHWVNPASAEFQGQAFTRTFIYGFYDGSMAFLEPMVTRAFLQSRPDVTAQLALPQQYAQPRSYPTTYRVRYDAAAKQYQVILGGFVQRS